MAEQYSVRYLVRRLIVLMWANPIMTIIAAISILTSIGFSLALPLLIRALINNAIGGGQRQLLLQIGAGIIGISILSAISAYVRSVTTQWLGERVSYALRNQLYRHLESLSFSFYDTAQSGQLLSILTEDIRNIRRFYSPALRTIVQTAILIVGTAAIMLTLDLRLAIIALVMIPILLAVTLSFSSRVRPRYLRTQRQFGETMSVLQENLAGTRLVRAFGREHYEEAKFSQAGEVLFARQMEAARLSSLANANMPFITGVGTVLIVAYGGWQVLNGDLQAGTLLAFYLYLNQLTDPIRQIGPIMNNVALALASTERVYELLARRPRIVAPVNPYRPDTVRGHVTFEDVSFAYSRNGRTILHDIAIEATPGAAIGLVGTTGSGKTSIVQLMARFYEVTGGRVLIDGVDVREWDLPTLRANVGFVSQETFLFSDSIRDNISYGRPEATDAEVVAAARAAQAHDFISQLPQGYATVLGERGVNLSGGQKQRLAIARALLLNPRVLVFDEATSAVDMETEREIQIALDTLMAGRTTFIIAQRVSSVLNADQICVLSEGRIVERGTHSQLLLAGGIYRQTYDLQTRDADVVERLQADD